MDSNLPPVNPQNPLQNTQPNTQKLASNPLGKLPSIKGFPSILKSKFVKLFGIVVFLIIFIVASLTTLTVYSDLKIPLISDYKNDLILIYYKIPLIPQTPEQILIAAVDKNTRLKTYTPNFSFAGQIKNSDIELGSLDLEFVGQVDITDEKNIAFLVDAKAALNYGGKSYQLDGKIMKKDKAFYGKIDKLPDALTELYSSFFIGRTDDSEISKNEIQSNLEELYKKWVIYEFVNLPTKAREELEKNIENTSITNQIREEAQNFLLKSSILPQVEKLSDEKINGVDTYHLVLKPTKESTKKIILEYINENEEIKNNKEYQKEEFKKYMDSFAGSFEQFNMEIWVGKGDAIVRKSSFQTVVNLGFVSDYYKSLSGGLATSPYGSAMQSTPDFLGLGDLGRTQIVVSTVVEINDVNKPVNIVAPQESITYDKYFAEFTDAFLTEAEKERRKAQELAKADLSSIHTALTNYYVANNQFPSSLASLTGNYFPSGTQLANIGSYSYRINPARSKFIVYMIGSTTYNSTYGTPYYGVTTSYNFPHQLTLVEFTNLNQ